MPRRSSRLITGGYYHSDDESDSSSVTNISYRETPIKVFKKKVANRKSRTPTTKPKPKSNASPASDDLVPSDLSPCTAASSETQTETTMRTVSYVSYVATPRPALTPSSSRSQTPTLCSSITPEQSPLVGHFNYNRAALNFRPNFNKPLSGSGIDSSGYSSSEGTRRNPTAAANLTYSSSRFPSNTVAGYTSRFSSAFCDSISLMATAVHTKVMHLRNLANTSFSSNMKKACGLLLLLLIILLCIWFLFPLLTPLLSRMTFTTTLSQTKPNRQPVILTTPGPPPITMTLPVPVLDQAVVAAAVEAKMQSFMEEMNLKHTQLQQKQEHLISQRQDRLQLDLEHVQAKLEVAESSNRLRLEQEVAGLGRQMADYHTDGRSILAILSTKIQTLENQNTELYGELSSIHMMPPPAPCPDVSTSHDHNRLTPELQQAMEKWLTDRIKEHDAFMLLDKGSSSDCGGPMADKLPDFALETQGASVISTRCSETYRIRSACVTLFGFPLWYPSESPRTVIQGFPVQLPGKCWAFHGVEGTLVISLSHPITITHVTLDHLPRYNSPTGRIDSAPKDFEVYGMTNDTEEGTLLGTFTYDEDGESTQTFRLLHPSEMVYRFVELRVLSNWGHVEYTCLYRFRVHGQIAST